MDTRLFLTIVGIIAFVVAFSLGTIVTATTGVPLAGGILNGVLVSMVLTIGMKLSGFRFSGTMMWFMFSIPAMFTTTLGPPGLYKPIIAVIAGLSWDVTYRLVFPKRPRLGLYIGAIVGGIVITLAMFLYLGAIVEGIFPSLETLSFANSVEASFERLKGALIPLFIVNAVVTVIGVWLGEKASVRFDGAFQLR